MAKWKCEICGNGFENFYARRFDNKIYCPLCYFKKENQELKQKYENAVADYETTMAEKNKLKKQLENKYEKVGTLTTELLYEENTKLINQQKEFIKYLKDEIQKKKKKSPTLAAFIRNVVPLQQCLQKYKEIIGVSDENN